MISTTSKTVLQRVLTASAALALVLAPMACKDDPTSPPLVAATNVSVNLTAATYAAVSGTSFVIPNGGGALSPALAGQTVTVAFAGTGSAPTATITTGSGTIVADVSFGSCRFTVRSFSGGSVILPGDVLTVNPCSLTLNTAGKVVGAASGTTATLAWAATSSLPNPGYTVTISPTGQVTVTNPSGVPFDAGTVTVTPRTGSGD